MTGTSADGIDLVVCEINGAPPELSVSQIAHAQGALPNIVRDLLQRGAREALSGDDYVKLEYALSDAIANVAKKAYMRAPFDLLGVHGQTLWHKPPPCITPSTHQVLNPYTIARAIGKPVVWDFRRADVSAGGQGAPLAPFAHYCLFGNTYDATAVLNIGGIANVTLLPPDADIEKVRAWDTGPGMMLADHLARVHFDVKFDQDGQLAASGRVNPKLLADMLRQPFFALLPPKSCGREEFGAEFASLFAHAARELNLSAEDMLRTALALTAQAVADALADEPLKRLIVAGGGARNRTLLGELRQRLPKLQVLLSDDVGVQAERLEAIAFAILAYERWQQRPANLPAVTGALDRAILGSIAL